jgi:Family of unknown function (DUF6807)
MSQLELRRPADNRIQIRLHGRLLLEYVTGKFRPYWHPVNLPDGRCVSLAQPHDHVWHSGLYHCPKFIDDVSLWEPELHLYRQEHGGKPALDTDHHGTGRFGSLQTRSVETHKRDDGTIGIESHVDWLDSTGERLGRECQRWAVCHPGEDGSSYMITLSLSLYAEGCDRKLWAGEHGYSGLAWRGPRSMNGGTILNDRGESLGPGLTNAQARWVDYTGALDGAGSLPCSSKPVGAHRHNDPDRFCGLAFFNHPDNAQSSFFTIGHFGFVSAHTGYPHPIRLNKDQPLHLRYGVCVHAWPGSVERIEPCYLKFLQK